MTICGAHGDHTQHGHNNWRDASLKRIMNASCVIAGISSCVCYHLAASEFSLPYLFRYFQMLTAAL